MKRMLIVGLLGILLTFGIIMIAGCKDGSSGSSCAADNGCNSSSEYCGRSSCAAWKVGTSGCNC